MDQLKLLKFKLSRVVYFKHDEIVARIGGSTTRFHKLAYMACLISFSTEAYLIYNLAFLNLLPTFYCSNGVDSPFVCSRHMTCQDAFNKLIQTPKAHSGSGYSETEPENGPLLHNWV